MPSSKNPPLLWRSAAALASAGLVVLALPKFGLWPLGLVALVPLRLALAGLSFGPAFWLGGLYGLASGFGLLYWIANVISHYGGLSGLAAGLIVLGLVSLLSLWPALWSGLIASLSQRGRSAILFGAFFWVGLEWIRSWFLSGFPWEDLGYVLTPWPVLVQMADLGGVGLAGLLVLATNLSLAEAILKPGRWRRLAVLALAWAAAWGYGAWQLDRTAELARTAPRVAVRVVQGNIDQTRKWDQRFREESLDRYERLSQVPGPLKPELVVWPETAAPFFFEDDSPERGRLLGLPGRLGAWLLFGAPAYQNRPGGLTYYNRAWLLSPSGQSAGHMDKAHLVPFGEYVPLKRFLPFLETLVPQIGQYSPGPPGQLLRASFGGIGVLVCYESIFPELARAHVLAGAGLLANLTNDSWFGRSSAPYQHLSMLVWRAVETRRAAARAAQTGVSALIGPDGRLIDSLDLGREGQLTGHLPLGSKMTIYVRGGYLLSPACLILAGLAAWRPARRRRDDFGRRERTA